MKVKLQVLEIQTHPAFLLGDQGTLPLVDDAALLGGNIFTHFVLDSLALPFIDHLALGLGPGGALLLHDGGALLLVPGAALLVKLGGAFLLMDGLLDSPGKVDTLHLGDAVAFLLELLLASLLDVIGSLAILLVLEAALLTGDSFLDRLLGDLALTLLDISTDGVGHIMALPPGDGVIHGLGHLLADLLGDLAAYWLKGSCPDHGRGVSLEGDLEESQETGGGENGLHHAGLQWTDLILCLESCFGKLLKFSTNNFCSFSCQLFINFGLIACICIAGTKPVIN